ncbi:MAG TPA: Rid family hydrolase [Chlamydiales bacterium]|jgi:diphthine-ammonia ligase|nr:Rid family hydrolase [Chlamydiales bacterium]
MLDVSHIANMTLLISSMEDFSTINSVYASFFGSSPPARACVGVDLPKGVHLRMECIAHDAHGSRQSLHVQSLSYWAPANIGPYSQAISVSNNGSLHYFSK